MSTVSTPARVRASVVLSGVDWRTYVRLLRVFAERPAIRLTYDRGLLEIMSPLSEHETDNRFLARLALVLTEELGLPIRDGGSMTMRRRRLKRGLEPDSCFWIANEPVVRGKRHIDLRVDPPLDLAIEVDLTSSSLDRMGIYAALGVPEVWRLDHPALTFHALGANRKYAAISHSLSFPLVRPIDLMTFLTQRGAQDDNSVIRQFRAWIQQQIAGGASAPPLP